MLVTGSGVTAVYEAEGGWATTDVANAKDARKFVRSLIGDNTAACTCTILTTREGVSPGGDHATPTTRYAADWARAASALTHRHE